MDDVDRDLADAHMRIAVPRVFHDRSNPFDNLSDEEFRRRFRFTRNAFFHLVSVLEEDIRCPTNRSKALLPAQRLAVTLAYLAQNTFQILIGDMSGCSQSSVSRIVYEVCSKIVARSQEFVNWPNDNERQIISHSFRLIGNIPGIVGCIDGSHIKIPAPSIDENVYVNRKNFHSLNIGLICDNQLRFMWYSTKYPGSAHDSRVFRESTCYAKMQMNERNGILVGDSAYKAERFLIKPVLNPATPAEHAYTNAVCRIRVHIENAIGAWKRQWAMFHGEVRTTPERAAVFVGAAICLRNAAIDLNERPFDDETNDKYDDAGDEDGPSSSPSGSATMAMLIRRHFS